MMAIDAAATTNDTIAAISSTDYKCLNSQSAMSPNNSCGGDATLYGGASGGGRSPPVADMAQHMLRNILQGVGHSKKDLYALECELHEAGNNNNNNNNNSLNNNNDTKLSINNVISDAVVLNNNSSHMNNNNRKISVNDEDENEEIEDEEEDYLEGDEDIPDARQDIPGKIGHSETNDLSNGPVEIPMRDDVKDMDMDVKEKHKVNSPRSDKFDSCSVSEWSLSPLKLVSNNNNKDDIDEPIMECNQMQKSEQKELKRARVENIVSYMRSSPFPVPVNGCKKRKLYHPQQHDNSIMERYIGVDAINTLSEDEDETVYSTEIRKKVVEKNALKNQLRTIQEQLSKMQQKYVQLCTHIDQAPVEMDEITSDVDQEDDTHSVPSPTDKTHEPTSISSAADKDHHTEGSGQNLISPAISKMLSSKFLPHGVTTTLPHINHHPFPLHANFNGTALSLLQHQIFQEQQHAAATVAAAAHNHLQQHHHPHHHHPAHPYPAFNNAAAMYLGVSQKLLFEQEARLAKEAALASSTKHHQIQHQKSQPPLGVLPPQSSMPTSHSLQLSVLNGAALKESGSPVRFKNNQSPATTANASTSLSPISSTLSGSLSVLSSQQQLQESSLQPSTKTSADTMTATASTTTTTMATESNKTASSNTLNLEGLADSLKTEITTTLSSLIDTIMSRFLQQKRLNSKTSEAEQLLDRKSPRSKVIDRGNSNTSTSEKNASSSSTNYSSPSKSQSNSSAVNLSQNYSNAACNSENNQSAINVAAATRSRLDSNLFSSSKLDTSSLNSAAAAAALYSSMKNSLSSSSHVSPFYMTDVRTDAAASTPEQNEALSLVVPQKKKRHKVTDTRITPRTVSRILAQDGIGCAPPPNLLDVAKYSLATSNGGSGSPESPPPPLPPSRPFHHLPHSAPPMLPISLPTSVAIPNPSLHESQVFSSYSPFYSGQHHPSRHLLSSSPPNIGNHMRDSPPLTHHSSMFHPALLAAAQQQHQQDQQHQQQQEQQSHHQRGSSSPDFMNMLPNSGPGGDSLGPDSECNSMDFDGLPPTSSTLSPMHLRKAKLMFFWVRYPTSAVLKMYFPDIRFNKNNTAQLVKWFSNFREFYYIQMEKYARAAIADGIKSADDIRVSMDSDIYRVLNLHYNRNNHIEVPNNFRYVIEQTLKEFFKAIQMGKDQDQSWKKPIYKVIGRLDDPVPDYFKSPNFLEQLE